MHDLLNVAAQYGLLWLAALLLALGGLAIAWWISGGHAAPAKEMVSWRLAPAFVGVLFMVIAQINDISGDEFGGTLGRWLNDFLEEPFELLAIVFVNVTVTGTETEPWPGRYDGWSRPSSSFSSPSSRASCS